MKSHIAYKAGDRISYQPFVGPVRTITVNRRDPFIKNERPGIKRPGFSGKMDNGEPVWGYDEQIISVEPGHGS